MAHSVVFASAWISVRLCWVALCLFTCSMSQWGQHYVGSNFLEYQCTCTNTVIIPTQYRLYRPKQVCCPATSQRRCGKNLKSCRRYEELNRSFHMQKKRCHKSVDHSRSGLRTDAQHGWHGRYPPARAQTVPSPDKAESVWQLYDSDMLPPRNKYFVFLECEIQSWTERANLLEETRQSLAASCLVYFLQIRWQTCNFTQPHGFSERPNQWKQRAQVAAWISLPRRVLMAQIYLK